MRKFQKKGVVSMANQKSSHKAGQKSEKKPASRLASLKEAILGGKKKSDKASSGPAKEKTHLKKAAQHSAASKSASHKSHEKSHAPAQKKHDKHEKHEPVHTKGKTAAPVHAAKAAKTAPASAPAAATKKKSEGSHKPALTRSRTVSVSASRMTIETSEAVCREVACEGLATTGGYCRLHYIKNWRKIKRKELILKEGKLNQYIEELVAKYPDKYIEAIRQDLGNDKDFAKVIYDLDLDESIEDFDVEGESIDGVIDTIKRDFDDEGDSGF